MSGDEGSGEKLDLARGWKAPKILEDETRQSIASLTDDEEVAFVLARKEDGSMHPFRSAKSELGYGDAATIWEMIVKPLVDKAIKQSQAFSITVKEGEVTLIGLQGPLRVDDEGPVAFGFHICIPWPWPPPPGPPRK